MHSRIVQVRRCATLAVAAVALLVVSYADAADRVVLAEQFVSHECSHCPCGGRALSRLMENYPGEIAAIQLQGANPYLHRWVIERKDFYNFYGYPELWFNGAVNLVGAYPTDDQTYTWYRSSFLNERSEPTDVTIEIGATPLVGQTYRVWVRATVDPDGTAKTARIHLVVAVDRYPYATDSRYRNSVRNPDWGSVDVSLVPGESTLVTTDVTFDSLAWSRPDDIRLVAWAQKPFSSGPADVYNAGIVSWPLPTMFQPGDMNCDGAIDFGDINPFVTALSSESAYDDAYPDCLWLHADCDGDGDVTFADINPFVALLSGGE